MFEIRVRHFQMAYSQMERLTISVIIMILEDEYHLPKKQNYSHSRVEMLIPGY